ncbi:uncharacterized protein LOC100177916 [Ciona intestinalis]
MALSILTNHKLDVEDDDMLAVSDIGQFGESYENSLRPSLADKLQVGFLASDQFTQTYDTEILDIKQMTQTVQRLVEDMAKVKRDFQFTKQVMKAAFEEKLQNKAFELYTKLNDHELHEEMSMRRSFKQQLQDALVKMASHYKKYYEAKLAGKLVSDDSSGKKGKIATLEAELSRHQSVIQMMEVQMEQLRAELAAQPEATEITIDTSELDAMTEENKSLQVEISKLNDRVEDLTDSLEFREEKIKQLGLEIMEAKVEVEKEREATRRLAHQVEETKKEMGQQKMEAMKALDKQKFALEQDMASKLADNEQAAANAARDREKMLKEMEIELQKRLLEERKKFELRLTQEKEENQRKNRAIQDSKSLERVVEQQRQEIYALKQRLIRSQKQWEKKFAILRASLHALKDENYIRVNLQKQSATLKYASISYGPDAPIQPGSMMPTPVLAPGQINPKPLLPPVPKSLPSIKQGGRLGKRTNTLPSGVGTDPFSEEEAEEYEEEEDSFIPLPPKPPSVGDYMPAIA